MKELRFAFIILLLISIPEFSFSQVVPDQRNFLLFIGQDKQSILDYLDQVEKTPDGFMGYTSIQDLEGLTEPKDSGAGIQHLDYFLERFPEAPLQVGLDMVDALDDIVLGKYDDHIYKLADWIKKAKVPIFLRIGYEFDGPHNHYDPAHYVKAYKHIVDKFRSSKVDNVIFVWHSYAGYVEGDRLRWYPGDDYVEWIAISYFDPYNKNNMEKIVKLAKSKNKPLMIAEATPRGYDLSDDGKAWKLWFQKLFSFVETNDIKAVCYINTNWDDSPMFQGQNWGDSRIQANVEIKKRWLSAITK